MSEEKKKSFGDFGFLPDIMESIDAMGFTEPTPIQEQSIPIILNGSDLIGCAQTGTGKTAAFLLPLIHKISKNKSRSGISALVIVPTRELAMQIDQQLQGLAYFSGVTSIAIYGGGDGASWDTQRGAIEKGTDVIIATPGRFIAHLQLGYLKLGGLDTLILDEADRMLDMGFYPDLMQIVGALPQKRQTLMFSATMPPQIRKMANEMLSKPEQVDLAVSKPAEGVLQAIYKVEDIYKLALLQELLEGKELNRILLFSGTKNEVKQLTRSLKEKGHNVAAIHSDLDQKEREQALLDFKTKSIKILVATDIVSRGIDIDNIDLVINYHVPQDAEDYVHRVGRTARAASTGVAITLVNRKDLRRLDKIEKLIEQKIFEIPVPGHITGKRK